MVENKIHTVNDIDFDHGFNDMFEYYAHNDNGLCWQIFRHLKGEGAMTVTWMACVSERKKDGSVRMLNSIVRHFGGSITADPLAHLNDKLPEPLLEALTDLIKKGEWPHDDIKYEPPQEPGTPFDLFETASV